MTVSVDVNPPAASQADQDIALAYSGIPASFMARLQQLSDAKAKYDASRAASEAAEAKSKAALEELALGQSAQEAFAKSSEMFALAEGTLKTARADADKERKKGKSDADAMRADAQQTLDAQRRLKPMPMPIGPAAAAECKQLADEREAAVRLGERAVQKEEAFQTKIGLLHAAIDRVLAMDSADASAVPLVS
jgi:hypothetical protein